MVEQRPPPCTPSLDHPADWNRAVCGWRRCPDSWRRAWCPSLIISVCRGALPGVGRASRSRCGSSSMNRRPRHYRARARPAFCCREPGHAGSGPARPPRGPTARPPSMGRLTDPFIEPSLINGEIVDVSAGSKIRGNRPISTVNSCPPHQDLPKWGCKTGPPSDASREAENRRIPRLVSGIASNLYWPSRRVADLEDTSHSSRRGVFPPEAPRSTLSVPGRECDHGEEEDRSQGGKQEHRNQRTRPLWCSSNSSRHHSRNEPWWQKRSASFAFP